MTSHRASTPAPAGAADQRAHHLGDAAAAGGGVHVPDDAAGQAGHGSADGLEPAGVVIGLDQVLVPGDALDGDPHLDWAQLAHRAKVAAARASPPGKPADGMSGTRTPRGANADAAGRAARDADDGPPDDRRRAMPAPYRRIACFIEESAASDLALDEALSIRAQSPAPSSTSSTSRCARTPCGSGCTGRCRPSATTSRPPSTGWGSGWPTSQTRPRACSRAGRPGRPASTSPTPASTCWSPRPTGASSTARCSAASPPTSPTTRPARCSWSTPRSRTRARRRERAPGRHGLSRRAQREGASAARVRSMGAPRAARRGAPPRGSRTRPCSAGLQSGVAARSRRRSRCARRRGPRA